jgi:hypothetical protein
MIIFLICSTHHASQLDKERSAPHIPMPSSVAQAPQPSMAPPSFTPQENIELISAKPLDTSIHSTETVKKPIPAPVAKRVKTPSITSSEESVQSSISVLSEPTRTKTGKKVVSFN